MERTTIFKPMCKQRNTTLDIIRGFAILIVVIGHAIQANLDNGGSCFIWNKLILAFQMLLLMYVSGITLGYSFPNRNPAIFIKKKFLRLFIPYISWVLIHYFLMVVIGYRELNVTVAITEIFVSDFWFLRDLFMFFIVVWIVDIALYVLKKKDNLGIVNFLLLLLFLLVAVLSRIPLITQSISLWYYAWFIGGYFTYESINLLKKYKYSSKTIIFVGL